MAHASATLSDIARADSSEDRRSGPGLDEALQALIDDGYLTQPRRMSDIVEELTVRGWRRPTGGAPIRRIRSRLKELAGARFQVEGPADSKLFEVRPETWAVSVQPVEAGDEQPAPERPKLPPLPTDFVRRLTRKTLRVWRTVPEVVADLQEEGWKARGDKAEAEAAVRQFLSRSELLDWVTTRNDPTLGLQVKFTKPAPGKVR